MNDGVWRHVVAVRDGGNDSPIRLYIDGALAASGTALADTPNNTTHLSIGALPHGAPGANSFSGLIDDLGIWNSAVAANQIAAIHGLGLFSGVNLADPAIAQVLGMDTRGQSVSNVGALGHRWYYTEGLTGGPGATGGSVGNLDAWIVLGAGGQGITLAVPSKGTATMDND